MLSTKNHEPQEFPPEPDPRYPTPAGITLPEDHPCSGCAILETITGVPYCFLPRCDRDIFQIKREDLRTEAEA